MLEISEEEVKKLGLELERQMINAQNSEKKWGESIDLIMGEIVGKNQEIVEKDGILSEKNKEAEALVAKIQAKDIKLEQVVGENASIIENLNKKLKSLQNELESNNKAHHAQLEELEKSHDSEKLLLEQSKKRLETQEILYKQEIEALQSQVKSYSDEMSKINDLRCKDIKDKNIEIQELKQSLAKKTQEINEIEVELQNLTLSHEIQSEGSEGGIKSLWTHIDQLNKQIEEKNQM